VESVGDIDHPILEGASTTFASHSWLYRVDLAPDCEPLLWGSPVDTRDSHPQPGPTAWIREQRRRTFVTTLGHPDDFDHGPLRRLLTNATSWCLQQ
jgi:hypothetical protein